MGNQSEKPDRRHKIPVDYLDSLADRIISTKPTKEIVFNSLKDLYKAGYTKGWLKRLQDGISFKNKREQHFKEDWRNMRTVIDDIIHPRENNQKRK